MNVSFACYALRTAVVDEDEADDTVACISCEVSYVLYDEEYADAGCFDISMACII